MSNKTCAVILAAGEGKRMKAQCPKVLCEVLEKPMLGWVINSVLEAGIEDICVVSGFKHEMVEDYVNSLCKEQGICIDNALQTERLGTAHAVMMADQFLNDHQDYDLLVLNGDAPFVMSEVIAVALKLHRSEDNSATVISAQLENPFGYGRIIRDKDSGALSAIVEQKDATDEQLSVDEVNSGAYWFKTDRLLSVLHTISNNNAQGEYYLPDTVEKLLDLGYNVNAYKTMDPRVVMGANDSEQLKELNNIAKQF